MSEQSTSGDPMAAFGPNEWLVDELYERYLSDKNSVDKAWWEFFKDYDGSGSSGAAPAVPTRRQWHRQRLQPLDQRPLDQRIRPLPPTAPRPPARRPHR